MWPLLDYKQDRSIRNTLTHNKMKKFSVSIMEVYEVVYSVKAETKEEAIRLALDGVDDNPYMEYSHTLEPDPDLCFEMK